MTEEEVIMTISGLNKYMCGLPHAWAHTQMHHPYTHKIKIILNTKNTVHVCSIS